MRGSKRRAQDKRYRRVETLIQNTVDKMYLSGEFITKVLDFSKRAEINPASFYAHYHCIGDAIMARDKNMCSDFANYVSKIIPGATKKYPRLEILFRRMFLFACRNKTYFKALVKRGNFGVFEDVVIIIKPVIIRKWQKHRIWDEKREMRIEEIFYDFSYEIMREFGSWIQKDNLSVDKISMRAKRLTYCAETACQRLGKAPEAVA